MHGFTGRMKPFGPDLVFNELSIMLGQCHSGISRYKYPLSITCMTYFITRSFFKKFMDKDWNPDAPEVNKAFSQAEKAEQKLLKQEYRPVSKLELEQLRKERGKPIPQQTLTIGGKQEARVHKKTETFKENRMQHLKERLGSMRGRAKNDFERSRGDDDDISW